MYLRLSAIVIGLLSSSSVCSASIRLAAEDWPPYTTPSLPNNGVTGALVNTVFARLGHKVDVDYYPWKRAVEYGLHDPRYAGYLAVWRTPEREKLCYFSTPVGHTQSVLAYLKDGPVQAANFADLRAVRVGVVSGYTNGDEFDALVHSGVLHVEEGVSDEVNFRKLQSGRFSAMVIEKHVLRYLLTRPQFQDARQRVAFSTSLFRERTVHVCFKRTPDGLSYQQAFNNMASKLNMNKIEHDYWHQLGYDNIDGD